MRRLARAAPIVLAIACGVLDPAPSTTGPTNACATSAECVAAWKGGVCSRGSCVEPAGAIKPIYVVHVATSEGFAPGFTFAFNPRDAGVRPAGCNADKTLECNVMPPIHANVKDRATVQGSIEVSTGLMKKISPPNGLMPNVPLPFDTSVSLPVSITFRPLWLDPSAPPNAARPLWATSLGLPLPTLVSSPDRIGSPPAPTNATVPGFGIGFVIDVPLADPRDGNALYEIEADPLPPYQSYPPIVQSLGVGGGPLNYHLVTLPSGSSLVVTAREVKIVAAAAPPRDYRIYIARPDGVRVSSLETLKPVASQDVVLYTSVPDIKGYDLVLEPPLGSEGLITQKIAENGDTFAPGIFPSMPPPVTIAGRVSLNGDIGSPVDAELVFHADELDDVDGKHPVASYEHRVKTRSDPQHAGEYSVTLPPGTYKVYAVPQGRSSGAITVKSGFRVTTSQVGAGITVVRQWHLRGRVVLSNGTPVAATEVLATATPEAYAGAPPPVFPRDSRTTTDDTGKFDLLVDEGTYDLTVRPNVTTRLPFVLSTQHPVTADVDLATDIKVPLPSVRRGILLDAAGGTMVRTLVRAYAFPDKSTSTRPARLVGEAFTDASGIYELFLAGSPN